MLGASVGFADDSPPARIPSGPDSRPTITLGQYTDDAGSAARSDSAPRAANDIMFPPGSVGSGADGLAMTGVASIHLTFGRRTPAELPIGGRMCFYRPFLFGEGNCHGHFFGFGLYSFALAMKSAPAAPTSTAFTG
jgi:hypothetical protein